MKLSKEEAIAHRKMLDRIHSTALAKFTYRHDSETYGVQEHWTYPGEFWNTKGAFAGDCDDFAMYCRGLCDEQGIPSRLVICYTETGEGHLVLESYGWILDNRQRKVVGSNSAVMKGYQWKYISGFEPGDSWFEITHS